MEVVRWLYHFTGWHDPQFFALFFVWNAILTVTAIAAYLRNGRAS